MEVLLRLKVAENGAWKEARREGGSERKREGEGGIRQGLSRRERERKVKEGE